LNKGNDFELLQSFTAGITGTLDRIALPVYEDVIIPSAYNKDVWYNSDATVTVLNSRSAVLGRALISAASIPNTSSREAEQDTLDVNALFKLSVTKGSLYFIAVQANRIVPADYAGNGLSWFGTVADYPKGGPYGSYHGNLFPFFFDSYDLEFRTYVTPTRGLAVPEPSTWVMMLLGFAGLALAGYRRVKADHATIAR
jgi:hypothetical protein